MQQRQHYNNIYIAKQNYKRGDNQSIGRVILFQNAIPFWQTDATLQDHSDLVIISGNADNEWHYTILAAHVPLLLAALTKDARSSFAVPADASVLDVLANHFAGDQNPYDDILHFLEQHAIPVTATAWLSSD